MSHPPLVFTYKVYRIEKTSSAFPFLTGKYAALSLRALSTNPESFGVAYATEASWTSADYAKRCLRHNVNVFVAVAHAADLPEHERNIERGAWVGMVTQIGSTPKATFWLPDSGASEPLPDAAETHWHQTATWVDPAHRGAGVAALLVTAGVAHALESSRRAGVAQVRVRAFTGPDNVASKALYGRSGFPVVGKCCLGEAVVANGNAGLPVLGKTDWSEEMLTKRVGLIMERVVVVENAGQ